LKLEKKTIKLNPWTGSKLRDANQLAISGWFFPYILFSFIPPLDVSLVIFLFAEKKNTFPGKSERNEWKNS